MPEAARHLGISERSVRKRLVAGTLDGVKEGKSWTVLLHATPDAAQDAVPTAFAVPSAVPLSGPDAALAVTVLERLLREERRAADENRDAALHWQFRALQAEERLAALEAGPIAQDTGEHPQDVPLDTNTGSVRDAEATKAAEPDTPSADTLALGWRRWFRRIVGKR